MSDSALFQLVLSEIWLTNFQYGPEEWIWKCLHYGRRFPFRSQYYFLGLIADLHFLKYF
ncbi:DUF418 domain-containing protein [Lunatibacter salilacus]|uniref:DUF418 domain-containing protein n=1 Tax=Lunatibacter salilacus TaxID=2483804 RepID=UPI0037434835